MGDMKNRVVWLLRVFIVALLLLGGRFSWLSLVRGRSLAEKAKKIQTGELELSSYRGSICDSKGIPLTQKRTIAKILVNKNTLDEEQPAVQELLNAMSELMQVDRSRLFEPPTRVDGCFYVLQTTQRIGKQIAKLARSLEIDAVNTIICRESANQSGLAQHLVGYLDAKGEKGIAGLELAYNSLLATDDSLKLTFVKDALQRAISIQSKQDAQNYTPSQDDQDDQDNQDPKNSQNSLEDDFSRSYATTQILTTIDYRIQKAIEGVLDRQPNASEFKGAVVLSEVSTGRILAMASRPNFSATSVAQLPEGDSSLVNRALSAYAPGSIFKLVDSAAWLETFGTDFTTHCAGHIDVNTNRVSCSNTSGHGDISLLQAFASSCNPFFVKLTQITGAQQVLTMAKRFGFAQNTALSSQGVIESQGYMPTIDEVYNEGDLANLSLGQGNLTVTPLQVNAMMAAIANDGIYCEPTILSSMCSEGGLILREFEARKQRRVISKTLAANLQAFCVATVEGGTGRFAKPITNNENEIGEASGNDGKMDGKIENVAGKTGTAESGNGEPHAWFTGFFPVESPQYAMTVLCENGGHGGSVAGTLFRKICRAIEGYMMH